MTAGNGRVRALATAALILVTGCGGEQLRMPLPQRAAVHLSESEVRGIAQLLRFEDERRYNAAAFNRLADGGVEVRRRVAMAAGRIGDIAAIPLLVRLLDDDPDPAVRADAAFALGLLGDTSQIVLASLRGAVPNGWVPVRDAETAVVVEVVQALGKLGSFGARALVLDALRAAHLGRNENARRVAAEGLLSVWRFDTGPGRVGAVARYLDHDDPELRWRAAWALTRMGSAMTAPAEGPVDAPWDAARRLLSLLEDDDHRARANAARVLSAGVADRTGVRDTALVLLTRRLRDDHPHVRINTVRALASYREDAPVAAMSRLLQDPDAHVAIAAAAALTPLAAEARDPLLAAVRNDRRPPAVRAAAASAVVGAEPGAVADAVQTWASGEFRGRYSAARTLPSLPWDRAEPLLRRLVEDGDRRVAVAALTAAGQRAADTTASRAERSALEGILTTGLDAGGQRARVSAGGLGALVDSTRLAGLLATAGVDPDERPARPRDRAFYEQIAREYVVAPLAGEPRPQAVITTLAGEITLELLSEEAPLTVHNFIELAEAGFWDRGVWHRVVPNFVLQDGAPAGNPSGGPGWSIRDEINRVRYGRGVLGMALAGPDTGGSQWFITHSPQHHLDGGYTIFGRVIDGMDVADRVLQGDPIPSIEVR